MRRPLAALLAVLLCLPFEALPALASVADFGADVTETAAEEPRPRSARLTPAEMSALEGNTIGSLVSGLTTALTSPTPDAARVVEQRLDTMAQAVQQGRPLPPQDTQFLEALGRAWQEQPAAEVKPPGMELLERRFNDPNDAAMQTLLSQVKGLTPEPEAKPNERLAQGAVNAKVGLGQGIAALMDAQRKPLDGGATGPAGPRGPPGPPGAPERSAVEPLPERTPPPAGFKTFAPEPAAPGGRFSAAEQSLLNALGAENILARTGALDAIAAKGSKAAPLVLEALRLTIERQEDGKLSEPEFRSRLFRLLSALSRVDARTLADAARTDPSAAETLVASLDKVQEPEDVELVQSLLARLGPMVVPALTKRLPESYNPDRLSAALKRHGVQGAAAPAAPEPAPRRAAAPAFPPAPSALAGLERGATRFRRPDDWGEYGVDAKSGEWRKTWVKLSQGGPETVPVLSSALDHANPNVAAGALRALAAMSRRARLEAATLQHAARAGARLLELDDALLRGEVLRGLADMPPDRARAAAAAAAEVAAAGGSLADAAGWKAQTRLLALQFLARLGPPVDLPVIKRVAALLAEPKTLGAAETLAALDMLQASGPSSALALKDAPRAVLTAIVELALGGSPAGAAERARGVLSLLGPETPIRALVDRLERDRDPGARGFDAAALRAAAGTARDAEAYQAFLISRLDADFVPSARIAALEELERTGLRPAAAQAALAILLTEPNKNAERADYEKTAALHVALRRALAGLEPAAVGAAFYARAAEGLASNSPRIRLDAASLLAAGGAKVRPHLVAVVAALASKVKGDDPALPVRLLEALKAAGPAAPEQAAGLAAFLEGRGPEPRAAAVKALGAKGLAEAALAPGDTAQAYVAARVLFEDGYFQGLDAPDRARVAKLLTGMVGAKQEGTKTAFDAAVWLGALGPDAVDAVPTLAKAFSDPSNGPFRTKAGEALAKIDPVRAVEVLQAALASGDPVLRRRALAVLARDEGGVAANIPVQALEPLLSDPHSRLKAVIILRAWHPGHPAGRILTELAQDGGDWTTRLDALYAMARLPELRPEELAAAVKAVSDADRHAAEAGLNALGRHGAGVKRAVTAAAAAMRSENSDVQEAAVEALARMADLDPDAELALVSALDHPDRFLRAKALAALEEGPPRSAELLPALAVWLARFARGGKQAPHGDPHSRSTFLRVHALTRRLAGEDAALLGVVDELKRQLESPGAPRPTTAAAILAAWAAPGDQTELVRLLAAEPGGSAWSVPLLARLASQDDKALAVLIDREYAEPAGVREARKALASLAPRAIPAVLARRPIHLAAALLMELGPEGQAALLEALEDPARPLDHRIRALGSFDLSRLPPEAAPRLAAWLGPALDSKEAIPAQVVRLLAWIGGPEAAAALKRGLASPQSLVRSQAASALAAMPGGMEEALPTLLEGLRRGGDTDRARAKLAIASFGPLDAVVEALGLSPDPHLLGLASRSPRPEVRALAKTRLLEALQAGGVLERRELAAYVLGDDNVGGQDTVSALTRVLSADPAPEMRRAAAAGLAKLAERDPALRFAEAVPALAALLQQAPDERARASAIKALGSMGWQGEAALPALAALYAGGEGSGPLGRHAEEAAEMIRLGMRSPLALRSAPEAELLARLQTDAHPDALAMTARSLAAAGNPVYVPDLERALERLEKFGHLPEARAAARSTLLLAIGALDRDSAVALLVRSTPAAPPAPAAPPRRDSLLETARQALAATPLSALLPGLAAGEPGQEARLAGLRAAGAVRWYARHEIRDAEGRTVDGWAMQWKNGALQFEAPDGRFWMLAPDGARASGNSRTGEVVRVDERYRTSFPANRTFQRTRNGATRPETWWSPSLDSGGVQGQFEGQPFGRKEGETPRLAGNRLSFYASGPDGRETVTGWIDSEGGEIHAYDVLPAGLGLVRDGSDFILNPAALPALADGSLDLSGIPVEQLPESVRVAFTGFLKAFPSLHPEIEAAYRGENRPLRGGDAEVTAVTGLNIVFDKKHEVYRLHMNVTKQVDGFNGRRGEPTHVQHYAEVLPDGRVRVFTVLPDKARARGWRWRSTREASGRSAATSPTRSTPPPATSVSGNRPATRSAAGIGSRRRRDNRPPPGRTACPSGSPRRSRRAWRSCSPSRRASSTSTSAASRSSKARRPAS
ncbi:MAG: HEAT repeat domain-containing protein [Elusimicrobia bacterium]|nr:HEAT repeat domain-containing protein [Elusimicrobiota bacterium]